MFPHNLPIALRPLFLTARANRSLRLYTGPVDLKRSERSLSVHAEVSLEWLPSPRIQVDTADVPFAFSLSLGEGLSARLPSVPHETPIFTTHIGQTFRSLITRRVEFGVLQGFTHLLFHIPNFPQYIGAFVARSEGSRRHLWAGRVVLEAAGWRVTLDSMSRLDVVEREISKSRGFGITHVGRLERMDGGAFGANDAIDILEKLSFFFSFVRGAWTSCLLPVAFGDDGQRRWAEWSAPRVAPGICTSWFSLHHVDSMANVFPGFLARTSNPIWWQAISLALNWYFECNTPNGMIQTALILQQNALELLAWTLFVEDGPVSEEGFDRMPASDRIRLMLDRARIPLSIPGDLGDLARLANSKCWSDGPQVIAEIRNALVHPKKQKRLGDLPEHVLPDAWRLGVWYLELALLWLFNYAGEYQSRIEGPDLLAGTRRVPWAVR